MKSSDWFTMIVIAGIGVALSVWATNSLLGNPDDATFTLKTIPSISSSLAEPDSDVFNVNAINPTVDVYVGSCKDADGDGVINSAEQRACNELNASGE